MFCPNCGTENPEGAKFCQKCGTRLETSSTNRTNGSEGTYDSIWNDNQNGESGAGKSQIQNPNDPGWTKDPFASQDQNAHYGQGQNANYSSQQNHDYGWQQGNNNGKQGPYYGDQQGFGYGGGNNGQPPKKCTGKAIASLVLGIIGITIFFIGGNVGLILGIIGLPLALSAKKKGDQSTVRKAGFITSLISLILGIIMVILQIVGVSSILNSSRQDSTEDEYEVIEETEEEETETETEEETIEETEETVAETEETEAETEEETQAVTEDLEFTFETETVVDNEVCSITITEVVEDDWGCTLTMELENKTEDQILTFAIDNAYLSGLYYEQYLYNDVTAGNTDEVTLVLNETNNLAFYGVSDLSTIGLGVITDIGLSFWVYNEDYAEVVDEVVHIYPYGEENATTYERESVDTDVMLIDNDILTFTVVGCEYDESWDEYQIDIFVENNTDVEIVYQVVEETVNGSQTSSWCGSFIDVGCCCYGTLYWSLDDLEEIGITDPESEIETIELDLEVNDVDWNSIYTDTLTLNP